MERKRRSGAACAALLLAMPAAAQAPRRLTLDEARALAKERSWDVLAARADLDAASAAVLGARALPNPTLALQTSKIPSDGTPAGTSRGNALLDRSYDSTVSLSELVEVGGKRKHRISSAERGAEAADARLHDARRRTDAAVVRSYAAAAAANAGVAIARATADSLLRSADIADARLGAGEISAVERDQVRLAADRFRAEVLAAEAAARQGTVALELLLGIPAPSGATQLADALPLLSGIRPPAFESDDAVLARRPDVAAAEAALRRAEEDAALQRALRVPDPTLLALYEREPPDRANSVGLGVSFPLPVLSGNRGPIRAADVARESAARELALAKTRALAEIAAARAAWDAASGRSSLLHDVLVPRARSVRDTVAFAYEKGGATLLELLEAERGLNELLSSAAQASADAASSAAELHAALALDLPGGKP